MIQRTTFLGYSLRTRTRRRALVLAYYGLLLLFLATATWRHKSISGALLAQTFALGSFFGGLRAGSIVKTYSTRVPDPDRSPIQQLNLGPVRPFVSRSPLDEREMHERDHAHYLAYSLLNLSLFAVGALTVLGMNVAPAMMMHNSVNLLWGFTIWTLSLPQSVILWTEPDPIEEGHLKLVTASS
jgi:hypothetical protein